eukprot:2300704-Alexandrium_andersonii.AAC.1
MLPQLGVINECADGRTNFWLPNGLGSPCKVCLFAQAASTPIIPGGSAPRFANVVLAPGLVICDGDGEGAARPSH